MYLCNNLFQNSIPFIGKYIKKENKSYLFLINFNITNN